LYRDGIISDQVALLSPDMIFQSGSWLTKVTQSSFRCLQLVVEM
jgi:hypothetical protein